MKLAEANARLQELIGIPFCELVDTVPEDSVRAKGRFGLELEKRLGLNPLSQNNDFEDGELKTNMWRANLMPEEPVWICQISNLVNGPEGLLSGAPKPFELSYLYRKIRNVLVVGVVKLHLPPAQWHIGGVFHLYSPPGSKLFDILRVDYDHITKLLRNQVEKSGNIGTANGVRYLQVRTKDGKPYTPIFSEHYNRYISNKGFAYYFKAKLVRDLHAKVPELVQSINP